jgi:hypothetical protein
MKKLAIIAAAIGIAVATAPGAHADTYDDLFYWVDWMAKKYNMGTVYVSEQYMADGEYGESNGRTIIFNKLYVDNPQKLYNDLSSDVGSHYHPGARCTASQALAAHESAHVLDWETGYTARYELAEAVNNGLSGQLTGYSFNADGTLNIPEALADAMVAVECDVPTPAEQAIYNMLTT